MKFSIVVFASLILFESCKNRVLGESSALAGSSQTHGKISCFGQYTGSKTSSGPGPRGGPVSGQSVIPSSELTQENADFAITNPGAADEVAKSSLSRSDSLVSYKAEVELHPNDKEGIFRLYLTVKGVLVSSSMSPWDIEGWRDGNFFTATVNTIDLSGQSLKIAGVDTNVSSVTIECRRTAGS